MHIKLLLCLVVVIAVTEAKLAIPNELVSESERAEIIKNAIRDAKFGAELQAQKQSMAKKIKKPITADYLLNRGFKKPSEMAIKQGKARYLIENIIKRAEHKLEEMAKSKEASSASVESQAERLAQELYHKPGSLLTSDEIALIYSEVEDCRDVRKSAPCPKEAQDPTINQFRRIDGTCNNLDRPTLGASDTGFRRIIDSIVYDDGISSVRGITQNLDPETAFKPPFPSGRFLSQRVVRDIEKFESPFSHLLMQFGQFLDHDLDLGPEFEAECEGCEVTNLCAPIRVEADDPVFGKGSLRDGECTPFRRSIPTCEPRETIASFPATEQINVLTSFIDGSMIYGSNERVGNAVRAFRNGLLKVRPRRTGEEFEALPIDDSEARGEEPLVACLNAEDCFLCGDARCNEQASLTIMHTLWLRVHNQYARTLRRFNPGWDDERLFQEARKIVGGLIQKIVYYDYLPKIMGNAYDITIGPYTAYNNKVDPSVPNAFATAAYRYGHSLVLPEFSRLGPTFAPVDDPVNLTQLFFNPEVYDETGEGNQIIRGWTSEPPRRADEFVNSFLTNNLFQSPRNTIGNGLDLAALNIQRGRDHGLPLYGNWRDFCAREFPELGRGEFQNSLTQMRFVTHNGAVELADLWPAGLSERRVENSLIGPTFNCIFGITFKDVRDGDRFYFESVEDPLVEDSITVFTDLQRYQISEATFSTVICDNTDTPRMQRDAFRIDQERTLCTRIPKLDLIPWIQVNGQFLETCFVPIEVTFPGRLLRVRSRIISHVVPGLPSSLPGMNDDHFYGFNDPSVQCLPIPCPLPGSIQRLFAFTLISLPNQARCPQSTPGNRLRSNTDPTRRPNLFRQDITNAVIDDNNPATQPPGGIFRDKASCLSADPSIVFTCSVVPAAAAEINTKNDINYDDTLDDLPEVKEDVQKDEELLASLQSKRTKASPASNSHSANEMHHQEQNTKSQNEDHLQEDLQELLEKLSN